MTELLEQAFEEASKLTKAEQDHLGSWLLKELASERRWMEAFPEHPDRLAELADEALAEHHGGKTQPLDPEAL